MTIEEMRKHEWTVSWSGGKDSTATVILCHEYGIPIKEIVYVRMMYDEEMPATLPIMTEFVERAKGIFETWGYNVRIVKGIETAEQLIYKKFRRSKYEERVGQCYGVMAFMRGMCKFTDVKQRTLRQLSLGEYRMIGYASDEYSRLYRLGDKEQSIMVTLGVREIDTYNICRKYGLLSPFYSNGIDRDGCWFCPNSKYEEMKKLREQYPELYNKIVNMIDVCKYDIDGMVCRNNWVKEYYNELGIRNRYKEKRETGIEPVPK